MERSDLHEVEQSEARYIAEYFHGRTGRFLDIGAGYGRGVLSKTERLVDAGWWGVLVEASAAAFERLLANYRTAKRLTLVNAGVAIEDGPLWFYDNGGEGLGTFDEKHRRRFEEHHGVEYTKVLMRPITPTLLIGEVGRHFEFVNIDAEGLSVPIFSGLVHASVKPELACIEKDQTEGAREIRAIAEGVGLAVLKETEVDVIVGKPR